MVPAPASDTMVPPFGPTAPTAQFFRGSQPDVGVAVLDADAAGLVPSMVMARTCT